MATIAPQARIAAVAVSASTCFRISISLVRTTLEIRNALGNPRQPRRFPPPWSVGPSRIYGQFTIVIFRVPPPSEGTVNVCSSRWHSLGGEGGGTTLGGE